MAYDVDARTVGTPFGGVLGKAALEAQLADLLKRMEKPAPLKTARELEARIEDGEAKIARFAASKGETHPALAEPRAMLAELKQQRAQLYRNYLIPWHVLHWLYQHVEQAERFGWPLKEPGRISVSLPGLIEVSVEVPVMEVPF